MTNATDDGCLGMSVASWAEGVSMVTGHPCPVARGGPTTVLVEAILAHCSDPAQRVDWARRKGADYARARVGRTIKPHDFADWLSSGSPSSAGGAGGDVDDERPEAVPPEKPTGMATGEQASSFMAELRHALSGAGKPPYEPEGA